MSPNTLDNQLEQKTKNISSADLKSELIQEYLRNKLKSKGSIAFLNELDEEKDVPDSMKKDLLLYIRSVGKYGSSLSESDINSLTYLDIIPEVTGVITGLRTKRKAVKNIFLREYDISSNKYDKNLEKVINKLDDDGLENLLELGEEERKELLQEVFGKNIPEKKNLTKFIKDFNLKGRLKKLSDEDRERFDYTVSLIQTKNGHLETSDLEELFDIGIFTESEKRELVSIFIPTMSLATARLLGIVSENEEIKIRYKYVDEGISHYGLKKGLSRSEVDTLRVKIFSDLQSRDLMIETASLGNFDKVLGKLIDAGELEKVVSGYNNVLYEANEKGGGIENYEQFENQLSESIGKLQAQKFKQGSTLVLKEKDAQGEEHIFFFEIFNNGKNTGNIVLKPRGHNGYDKYDSGKIGAKSFDEVIGIANNSFEQQTGKTVLGFQVLDEFDLKTQIDSGNIEVNHDAVEFLDDSSLKAEKKKIAEELAERKKELKDKGKRNSQIENDALVNDLQEKQEQLDNDDETLDIKNEKLLAKAIDDLDPEGKKFGFHENTSFKSQKGSVFTIKHINPASNKIVIFSPSAPGGVQEMSYTDFVTAFKGEKAKRISSSRTLTDVLENVSSAADFSKEWSKFHIDKGEIRLKENKKKIDFDYLVGDDNELIKIVNVNEGNGLVTINFGKVEQSKEHNKDKKGNTLEDDTYVKETFRVDPTKHQVTLGWLEDYIKSNNQIPRGLEEGKAEETNFKDNNDDIKPSFMSRLFKNNYSIFEIISGSKLMVENLQAFLKEGADEHAAQFANSFYGKFLPDEVKADLSARLESAQKKRSDEYIDKLKSIDSGPATIMIGKWLKNRDVPQYKLEAGLLFMMEKYGTLYCKQIFGDDGSYLWYRALGGTVGDKLFMEEYQAAKDSDVTFSEEQLIYALLGKQIRPPGHNGILRRSRIQKDYKAVRIQGKKDEIEKGKDDALRFRQIDGRVKGAMDELDGGNYPNAVGWIEEICNKGGTYEEMNKIPFIMAFSGIMYSFDDAYILDQIKNFNAKNMPIAMTRFMSKRSEMDLLNNTIMEICKRMDDLGTHPGIYEKALNIKGKWHGNTSDSKKDVILQTQDFYDEYGEVLTNVLYQVNNGDTGENAFLNKMIMLEKDAGVGVDGKQQKGNATFEEFYNHNKALTDADAEFKDEILMSDSFGGVGVTGLNMRKIVKQNLAFRTGSPVSKTSYKVVWKEIEKQIQVHAKSDLSDELKQIYITDILRGFFAGILDTLSDERGLMPYEGGVFSSLAKWGIMTTKDLTIDGKVVNPEDVEKKENSVFEKRMKTWVNNIIKSENGGTLDTISGGGTAGGVEREKSSLELIEGDTKNDLNKIVDGVDNDFLGREVPDDIHVDLDQFKKNGSYNQKINDNISNNVPEPEYDYEDERES